MSELLSRLVTSLAYATSQLPRLAWYSGHLYALQQLAGQARRLEDESVWVDSAIPSRPRSASERRHGDAIQASDLAEVTARRERNALVALLPHSPLP